MFPVIPPVRATALEAGHHSRCATGEYKANASIYRGSSLLGSDIAPQSQRLRMNHCGGPSGGCKSELGSQQPQSEEYNAALLWLLWRITVDVLCTTVL